MGVVSRNDPTARRKARVKVYNGKKVKACKIYLTNGSVIIAAQQEDGSPLLDENGSLILYKSITTYL